MPPSEDDTRRAAKLIAQLRLIAEELFSDGEMPEGEERVADLWARFFATQGELEEIIPPDFGDPAFQ